MMPSTTRRRALVGSLTGALLLACVAGAAAQENWPARPVRMIVPFAPGGSTDVVARLVGQRLSALWNQPVVVENRAGAGGNVGADAVAKAPGDGYTLLMASGSVTINPALYRKMPFDTRKDDDFNIALKDRAILGNDLATNAHTFYAPFAILSAFSRTSSIVPAIMKACSGRSSHLPSRISRKPRTVSFNCT